MVDKRISDAKFRQNIARDIANTLDADVRDIEGQDGKIVYNVWNDFVSDKGGRRIDRFIHVNTAVKSISTYLYREAVRSGDLISDIGDKWESNLGGEDGKSQKSEMPPQPKPEESSVMKSKSADNKRTNKSSKKQLKQPNVQANSNIFEPVEVDHAGVYKVDNSYSRLSKQKVNNKAKNDPRLEKLRGGKGWSVDEASFRSDVQYARKYTGKILTYIAEVTGADIVVTSALGTGDARNPHQKRGYSSHHNAENPKLDLKAENMSLAKLQKKLLETGFFCRVSRERTHLDVQIKPEVYMAYAQNIEGAQVSAILKENRMNQFLV